MGGEEPENKPEEDYESQSNRQAPALEDYTHPEDQPAVWNELTASNHTLLIRTFATGFMTLVLGVLEIFGGRIPADVMPVQLRGVLCLIGLGTGILFSLRAVRNGLKGLFTLKANGDSGMALALPFSFSTRCSCSFSRTGWPVPEQPPFPPIAVPGLWGFS